MDKKTAYFDGMYTSHTNGQFKEAKAEYYAMTQTGKQQFIEWLIRKGLLDLVVFFFGAELALLTDGGKEPWEATWVCPDCDGECCDENDETCPTCDGEGEV